MERQIKDLHLRLPSSRLSSRENTSRTHRKTVRFIVKGNTPEVGSPLPKDKDQSYINFTDEDEDKQILKDLTQKSKDHSKQSQSQRNSLFKTNQNHVTKEQHLKVNGITRSASQIFKFEDQNLSRKHALRNQAIIKQKLRNIEDKDQITDYDEEVKNNLLDRDLVTRLDTFEMKVAPTALHIFAENLSGRLKSMAFSQTNQSRVPFSKQLKILSDTKSTQSNTTSQSRPQTSKFSVSKEATQVSLNLNNLNSIMKDNQKTAIEQMFESKENTSKFQNEQHAMQKSVKEIEKYLSMQKGDLYSEEARNQVTKYKIYRPKTAIKEKREELIQKVKTTSQIANEKQFEVRIQKEMPINLEKDEVVATQMDLYVPLMLNQNIQKARLQRQKERMMEQLSSKLTKIEGFVDETFKLSNINERIRVETELLNEFKSLKVKIDELRLQRTSIFAENTNLHNQLQQMRQQYRVQDEEIRRMQLCTRTNFESKMKNMDKNNMMKDLIKLSSEKEQMEKMKDERRKKEMAIHKARDKNNERIYYVDQEIEVIKTQLQFILNVQKEYYLRLLREGQDTRQKGLVWIIQCLQCELEVPVIFKDQMPNILDERSKQFIIDLAKKDYKLVIQQKQLQEMKLNQKQELISDSRKTLARGEINFELTHHKNMNVNGYYFTENGFEPIRNGEKFQEIMNLKNNTIKQIQSARNEYQRGYSARPQKTITQIVNESNAMHSKMFGFDTLFTKNTKKLIFNKLMGQGQHNKSQKNGLTFKNGMYLMKSEQMQIQVDAQQRVIDQFERDINEVKMSEIRRLARDYLNNYSELKKNVKNPQDLRMLILCLFGDTSWEVEFNKQVKLQQEYKHKNSMLDNASIGVNSMNIIGDASACSNAAVVK
ncbi:UNKNOWN [Stylonychia lemnae]|uniref:Uncharacterized protein n=1 Tax=Stylonychia lemnae TaxID=5949 RepID=A0A078AYG6_STYLE|nr:UNKNOWN [Stylonychia lemnae]|eukprot:CDW87455.1 UNKNOWN [Stylonychia lemnae]